jgi:hypothetical protein
MGPALYCSDLLFLSFNLNTNEMGGLHKKRTSGFGKARVAPGKREFWSKKVDFQQSHFKFNMRRPGLLKHFWGAEAGQGPFDLLRFWSSRREFFGSLVCSGRKKEGTMHPHVQAFPRIYPDKLLNGKWRTRRRKPAMIEPGMESFVERIFASLFVFCSFFGNCRIFS